MSGRRHLELPGVRQDAFGVTWCQAGCIWSYLVSGRMLLRVLELKAGYTFRFFIISGWYALGVFVWPQGRVHYKIDIFNAGCNWRFFMASRQGVIGYFWLPQGWV